MSSGKTKIAILGATSHIAKGLISRFIREPNFSLHLFARSPEKVQLFLDADAQDRADTYKIYDSYGNFADHSFDVIINCIGVGTEKKLQGDYVKYFMVTEEYDNLIIRYLEAYNHDALYISFSSGVVYGRALTAPATEASEHCIRVNQVGPADFYAIARLNAEAKHRAFNKLNIIDLRIFSYFSRYINLSDGYFITDVINSIFQKRVLETSEVNIVRDYVHPDDLFFVVLKCLDAGRINAALDVISAKPVWKQEILNYFSATYHLNYITKNSLKNSSPTGSKNVYCSMNKNSAIIGYQPRFSSMETIMQEAGCILQSK